MRLIVRAPAVAGTFYPAEPVALAALVDRVVVQAGGSEPSPAGTARLPAGILVPHAGLVYSGAVAAAAWRLLAGTGRTVVILGTNHSAPFRGIAAWDGDAWATPLGDVAVDGDLTAAIAGLGAPFFADRSVHAREHSIEVQLPLLARLAPRARIVALSVSAGTGTEARAAGTTLGRLLATRPATEAPILAIATDMAHYPPAHRCQAITETLAPHILALDADALAVAEATASGPGIACGMCGIEPTVVGLAALSAMGATAGTVLAAATSADAGGDPGRTVGYLAIRFG